MGSHERSLATKYEREHNLNRLEKHLLRGLSNQHELAAAFGVTQQCIHEWISVIYKRWKEESPETTEDARTRRIKMLDHLAATAILEFERSRAISEEKIVQERICPECEGKKKETVAPGEQVTCPVCKGKGIVSHETVKTKGTPGDPAYINVAKACIESAARLEGLMPVTMRGSKTVFEETKTVGGDLHRTVTQEFYDAPVDLIIRARATLDEIQQSMKKGETKKIDVEVLPPQDPPTQMDDSIGNQ